MRYFLIGLVLMTTSLVTTQAEAAEVKVFAENSKFVSIYFRGEIRTGDDMKLLQLIKKRGMRLRPNYALYLDSPGGQMLAAFKVGYIVRYLGLITVIDKNSSCTSACAFVFIAGWDGVNDEPHRIKHPRGKLGVHHPYVELVGGRKRKSSKKAMDFTKDYFDEMRAGMALYKQMVRTHQKKMAYVKNNTLRRLPGYHVKKGPPKWPLKRLSSDHSGERYNESFWKNTASGQAYDQRYSRGLK